MNVDDDEDDKTKINNNKKLEMKMIVFLYKIFNCNLFDWFMAEN